MARLESSLGVWDNEKGWIHPHASTGWGVARESADTWPTTTMQEDSEPRQTSAIYSGVAPAPIVRAEVLRQLNHHPSPASEFPSSKRRCSGGIWTQHIDPMSVVLTSANEESLLLMDPAGKLEVMELDESGGVPDKAAVTVSALLRAHDVRTRALFPADRLESFRAVALARGAVAV